jgi:hypothetical protein
MGAKAAFGLLLLLAAVGGAFAAAPEEAPGCVFPKGSDSQAIETSVRDWARTSGLGAVSKWGVALDGPHAAVELVIDTGTLTISWQLDADCTPTNIDARGSTADVAVPAQATLKRLAAALPALHARRDEQSSIPWTPLALLALVLVLLLVPAIAYAVVRPRQAVATARAVASRALIALVGFGIGLAFAEIATRSIGLQTRLIAGSLF